MEWLVPILVAVIGGPTMWLLHRLDKTNSEQHQHNLDTLHRIEGKVDNVQEQMTSHIKWHLDNKDQ
jgi:hypothetical protein